MLYNFLILRSLTPPRVPGGNALAGFSAIVESAHILSYYREHPVLRHFLNEIGKKKPGKIHLKGLSGSSGSVVAASAFTELGGIHLFVLPDKEEAAYFYNDLVNIIESKDILFFPSSYKRSIQFQQKNNSNIIVRTSVLEKLTGSPENLAIVSYPEALVEKVVQKDALEQNTLSVRTGEKISLSSLAEILDGIGFIPVDFVSEPGQYAIRGSLLDLFSYSAWRPCRIDFDGNMVNSIREFEVESQLSTNKQTTITVLPDTQTTFEPSQLFHNDSRVSFSAFLGAPVTTWIRQTGFIYERISEIYEKTELADLFEDTAEVTIDKKDILASAAEIFEPLDISTVIETGPDYKFQAGCSVDFAMKPQPVFNKNFQLLGENLKSNTQNGISNFILSDNPKQVDRLVSIFEDTDQEVEFENLDQVLHEGFIDTTINKAFYTDHQVFERYHRFKLQDQFARSEAISIDQLTGFNPGDYVVHIDHGIGRFAGLEKINNSGRMQEAIKLIYRDNDILFVSIHSLHRISKYKGKDGQPPRIYKLGTGAWQKLKSNTKKKVQDIARELIELYARRKAQKGFSFSPDTYMQNELEASFFFEDTEDQLKATHEVKEGMEAGHPMDRLICGDVGFGKTEIAVRAAFKAVADNKQVALLVPTTILALQHYNTFGQRLKDFPCSIDYISRLKNTAKQKEVLKKLGTGELDIIIGTHRLVSQDVKFKDLGLLIIDEEQKFGVKVKEKLRKIKLNVDTLTLTATPIPRTLQLSLMGARDLSVIHTPPPNRHPIVTEQYIFNEDLIKEAIYYEVSRNGQVFFIHNRVQNIREMEALVQRICPGISTVVAHGQMEGAKLEKIMLDFIDGKHDVLIATTIIESGLDIPNVNTIFINNAQHFGLSDLHQLRGRVGRSNKKAFCYLLAPPEELITPDARKRLKAIAEFSDLGSGFYIALQDLDIRGAGNLLGAEQSGFIAEIGFETYHRILDEALQELKANEYQDLFAGERTSTGKTEKIKYVSDCVIDTDLELLFPDDYIENVSERLRLYRSLDNVKSENELIIFETQLFDRFGKLPQQTKELLQVVRLRWLAIELGFEKVIMKRKKMVLHFVSDQGSSYYDSVLFQIIIKFIQTKKGQFRMKENNGKLTLAVEPVESVLKACEILVLLNESVEKDPELNSG